MARANESFRYGDGQLAAVAADWSEVRAGSHSFEVVAERLHVAEGAPVVAFAGDPGDAEVPVHARIGFAQGQARFGVLLGWNGSTGTTISVRFDNPATWELRTFDGAAVSGATSRTGGTAIAVGDWIGARYDVATDTIHAQLNGSDVPGVSWTGAGGANLAGTQVGIYAGGADGSNKAIIEYFVTGSIPVRELACIGQITGAADYGAVLEWLKGSSAEGQPVTFRYLADGVEIGTHTVSPGDRFENDDNAVWLAVGTQLAVGEEHVGKELRIIADGKAGSGLYRNLSFVRPDPKFGTPVQFGTNEHALPSDIVVDGKMLSVRYDLIGRLWMSYDGEPQGVLFGGQPIDVNDRYHTGGAVAALSTGHVCRVSSGHLSPNFFFESSAAPGEPALQSSPVTLREGQNHTYPMLAASGTTLYVLSRGGNPGDELVLTKIENADTATPTVSAGVLIFRANFLQLPAYLGLHTDSNGQDVLVWASQSREAAGGGTGWGAMSGGVIDVATGQGRAFDGTPVGGTADGTTSSPKFATSDIVDGPLELFPAGPAGTNRYGAGVTPAARPIAGGNFLFSVLFVDSPTVTDAFSDLPRHRLYLHDGTTGSVTSPEFDLFDLNEAESYRATGRFRFTSDTRLEAVMGTIERGDIPSHVVDEYFRFGTSGGRLKRLGCWQIDIGAGDDLDFRLNPVFEGWKAVPGAAQSSLVRAVPGHDGFAIDVAETEASEMLTGAHVLYYDLPATAAERGEGGSPAGGLTTEQAEQLARINSLLPDDTLAQLSLIEPMRGTDGAASPADVTVNGGFSNATLQTALDAYTGTLDANITQVAGGAVASVSDFHGVAGSSGPTATEVATAVWSNSARTLTEGAFGAADRVTLTDALNNARTIQVWLRPVGNDLFVTVQAPAQVIDVSITAYDEAFAQVFSGGQTITSTNFGSVTFTVTGEAAAAHQHLRLATSVTLAGGQSLPTSYQLWIPPQAISEQVATRIKTAQDPAETVGEGSLGAALRGSGSATAPGSSISVADLPQRTTAPAAGSFLLGFDPNDDSQSPDGTLSLYQQ